MWMADPLSELAMNIFDCLAASKIEAWGIQASGLAAIIIAVVVAAILVRMAVAPD